MKITKVVKMVGLKIWETKMQDRYGEDNLSTF